MIFLGMLFRKSMLIFTYGNSVKKANNRNGIDNTNIFKTLFKSCGFVPSFFDISIPFNAN